VKKEVGKEVETSGKILVVVTMPEESILKGAIAQSP